MNPDKARIRELIERWVVWRDMGDWDRLRTIWHEDGTMAASWRQGTADEFIQANREGWSKGLDILHQLGASDITVRANRAVSMTKMVISQRAELHGVLCDVSCQSRHVDFWEARNSKRGLVRRETIFDRDRIDVVVPGQSLQLDNSVLDSYPKNYRHLAYLQQSIGYAVRRDMPCLRSAAADELVGQGASWLEGATAAPVADNVFA